ncbi:MAG: phospholipid carrier-dependent glycosyltransferase, partial [Chloroflexi bacterium]|nr:phospholipid carrier-dependent glycosyltransferase [Chloroflexota bacterium]
NHPPLYFLLLAATTRLAGNSEFALRFFSLAASVLLVPLLYVVGRRLADRRAGLLAALLGALSPMYLWYAQEARMYTLLALCSLLSAYTFWRAVVMPAETPRHRALWLAAYLAATVAMIGTHYLGFLVLLFQALAFLVAWWSRLGRWRLLLVGLVIAALPLLAYGLSRLPPAVEGAGFVFVPLGILLRDVLNSFSLGLSVDVTQVLWLDLVYLALFVLGLLAWWRAGRREAALFLLGYLVLPIALVYLMGYVRPLYMNSRHLILVTPPFYLGAGAGLAALRRISNFGFRISNFSWLIVGLTLIVAGSGYATYNYFTDPRYDKDDHRAWGNYLRAHARPGDVVVVDPPHIATLYQYYADAGLPWVGLPRLGDPDGQETPAALADLARRYDRLWLAFSHTPPWGDPTQAPRRWLEAQALKLDEQAFHTYASLVNVSLYRLQAPTLAALPPVQHPLQINLEGRLTLRGYDLAGEPLRSGDIAHLRLYWQAAARLDQAYKVSLRLLDDAGQVWAQADQEPLHGAYPTTRWQAGDLVADDFDLPLAPGTPPGEYRLVMVVYAVPTGQALAVLDAQHHPRGTVADLGPLTIAAASQPPRLTDLPIANRLGATFGTIELLGYDLSPGPSPARGGETAAATLQLGETATLSAYWRARGQPPGDYRLQVQWVDAADQVQAEQDFPLCGYPTSRWQPGEVFWAQYRLTAPARAPAGDYRLRLSLFDPASKSPVPAWPGGWRGLWPVRSQSIELASLTLAERPRLTTPPAMPHTVGASFGGQVALLGYAVEGQEAAGVLASEPGQALHLTLYWRALQPPDRSYTVFVHLVGAAERIVGQQDSVPVGGTYPTNLWLPGEVVVDEYALAAKPDAPAGRYRLALGLYDAATNTRLPAIDAAGVASPDGRVWLDSVVEVQRVSPPAGEWRLYLPLLLR